MKINLTYKYIIRLIIKIISIIILTTIFLLTLTSCTSDITGIYKFSLNTTESREYIKLTEDKFIKYDGDNKVIDQFSYTFNGEQIKLDTNSDEEQYTYCQENNMTFIYSDYHTNKGIVPNRDLFNGTFQEIDEDGFNFFTYNFYLDGTYKKTYTSTGGTFEEGIYERKNNLINVVTEYNDEYFYVKDRNLYTCVYVKQ
jgi:uncharacterized membrane protein